MADDSQVPNLDGMDDVSGTTKPVYCPHCGRQHRRKRCPSCGKTRRKLKGPRRSYGGSMGGTGS